MGLLVHKMGFVATELAGTVVDLKKNRLQVYNDKANVFFKSINEWINKFLKGGGVLIKG